MKKVGTFFVSAIAFFVAGFGCLSSVQSETFRYPNDPYYNSHPNERPRSSLPEQRVEPRFLYPNDPYYRTRPREYGDQGQYNRYTFEQPQISVCAYKDNSTVITAQIPLTIWNATTQIGIASSSSNNVSGCFNQ